VMHELAVVGVARCLPKNLCNTTLATLGCSFHIVTIIVIFVTVRALLAVGHTLAVSICGKPQRAGPACAPRVQYFLK